MIDWIGLNNHGVSFIIMWCALMGAERLDIAEIPHDYVMNRIPV